MLLTIDVGNTNTEFGLFDKRTLLGSFRVMSKGGYTSDELGLTMCEYFNHFRFNMEDVEDVIITSVVPSIMHPLKSAVMKYIGKRALVVNEDVFPNLRYLPGSSSRDHGADRGVACLAAVEKYGAPILVLDFGTATTIDAENREGVCIGGTNCTGLQLSMAALAHTAALLPRVELTMPETFLANDTITQIQTGVVGGYVGSVEYLIRRTKAEMEEPDDAIKVVATGGLSRLVASHTDAIDVVDSELILEGLISIYEHYRAER